MTSDLQRFLAGYVDRPFVWGRDDCSLFLADWWLFCHGVDPAAHLRGTYATEAEKTAIVDAAGGLQSLVAEIATSVGAKEIGSPSAGAFGVVTPGIGAIFAGGLWAVRSPSGVVFTRNRSPLRIWSIQKD